VKYILLILLQTSESCATLQPQAALSTSNLCKNRFTIHESLLSLLISSKFQDFDLVNLKHIIENNVYPNVYKEVVTSNLLNFFYYTITNINNEIVMKTASILGGTRATD